jgi:hypothetical protein
MLVNGIRKKRSANGIELLQSKIAQSIPAVRTSLNPSKNGGYSYLDVVLRRRRKRVRKHIIVERLDQGFRVWNSSGSRLFYEAELIGVLAGKEKNMVFEEVLKLLKA